MRINTMNKTEIAKAVAQRYAMPDREMLDIMDDIFSEIQAGLSEKRDVSIRGFGKFKIRNLKKRRGNNPSTGMPMVLPAHSAVSFYPCERLRSNIR